VATSMGTYLDSQPRNHQQALTTISNAAGRPQSWSGQTYFDANPQVAKDMQQLQQPLVQLVHPLQAAGWPAPSDGLDAGCTAAGRRAARKFARSTADRADHGVCPARCAGFAVGRVGRPAGRRGRFPDRDNHQPLALVAAHSFAGEAAELRFSDFLTIG